MCGIVFAINNDAAPCYDIEKFIQDGLIVAQLRGMDSTGLFQVARDHRTFMYKQAMCASNFIELRHTKPYLSDASRSRVTVGHVRAATSGKVSNDNAHPFEAKKPDGSGYILGVHNGSLTNWAAQTGASKFAVDSEWALNRIAHDGLDAFKEISGAYCFVWYDNSTENHGKLFVTRNSQRPMYFTLSRDKKQAYFMSEAEMLALVLARNNISTVDEVYSLQENQVYAFDLTTPEVTWSKSPVPVREITPVASYPSSPLGYDPYEEYEWRGYEQSQLTYDESTNSYVYDPRIKEQDKSKKGVAKNSIPTSGKKLIEEFKEALNDAPRIITKDDVPVKDDYDNYKAPATWYTTAAATRGEQATAEENNTIGEIVFMNGVAYEPSTCEIFGEVEDYDRENKTKIKYDAVVRGMSAHAATAQYGDGGWGVIIGEYTDQVLGNRVLVLSPFTERGKEMFIKAAA